MPHSSKSRWWFLGAVSCLVLGGAVSFSTSQICPWMIVDTYLDHAKFDVLALEEAIERYREENHALPENINQVIGTYIRDDWIDPWHRPFVYVRDGSPRGYLVYSLGKNGRDEGGAGDDVLSAGSSKKYACADYDQFCANPCEIARNVAFFVAAIALISITLFALYAGIRRMSGRAA